MVFLSPPYRQGVKTNSSIQVSLLQFAAAGNATAELDIVDESVQRYRYFYSGNSRRGIPDQLVEGRTFAKYIYRWGTEYFIVYIIAMGYTQLQYILKEPAEGETVMSGNGVTDKLIASIGVWQKPDDKYVYVYDGYWQASSSLYKEVQKANWDDVILNEEMKKTITGLMHKFFDSEDIYKDLGVPWKRGVRTIRQSWDIFTLAYMFTGNFLGPCGQWQNHIYQSADALTFQKERRLDS
jgi:transitional endoplasmic reticulum ATPase